jgi:transcriptional regulator with XRE-family HTH domain
VPPGHPDDTTTSQRIRLARLDAGLTEAELAERIGVPASRLISALYARRSPSLLE